MILFIKNKLLTIFNLIRFSSKDVSKKYNIRYYDLVDVF